ncbi:PIH1 domain-containing protein 1 [Entomortierella chlamydospora]|uniref:PIH1 domain-containing protein 1 n=1 Tax=Entomortierella chlamydospora TaxID=101097 RepID=A0A9P6MPS5_9FUNG|nr:PIH1 domain-containing protein 1 [Entomortierella chlamydospora]KAG0008864.1 PIH1 domain-containing protein 1 [Entomortierella chlamydospora]
MSFLDFDNNDTNSSSPFLLPSLASSDSKTSNPNNDSENKDARDAAEEEALLETFKKNPKAALALAESYMNASQKPRQSMTEITPVPGFVVQTQTTKESSKVPLIETNSTVVFPKDTLVFINVCSSDQMPKPTAATEAEIQKAINAEEGVTYQVPFQLSPPRQYRDSLSKCYLVIDACIHTEPLKRAEKDFDYKLYIMELAMEWAEEKCHIELSRNFQLPSLKSKDELKKRSVILPKPPAIQEVSEVIVDSTEKNSGKKTAKDVVVKSKEGVIYVPLAGKDDIVPKSRLLPCPKGTMGIIVEFDLPNHKNMNGVTLDVVLPDKLVLHAKSQDGGKDYHAEIDLPNEPVDVDAVQAEFSITTKTLRVYTIKKKRK